MTSPLTFPELLETLGYTENDHFSFCQQPPGGTFTSAVLPLVDVFNVAVPVDRNAWFGVNPVTDPAGWNSGGRGKVENVDRLVALYADLDAKDGGLGDFETAHAVIDVLSDMLTSRPAAVTLSGNGLQPYWPLEEQPTGLDAVALLRRFGRLVRRVAENHGGKVDSVYDLARVLRVPGSQNWKADPKPVLTLADAGHPLTLTEVEEALQAYGIAELPEDREQLGEIISDAGTWTWSHRTCHYVKSMIESWGADNPTERHPWLVSQATRLAAARRLGCITEDDHRAAAERLSALFRGFLAGGQARAEGQGEIADAFEWGATRIAAKTDAGARDELGHHEHGDAILALVPDAPTPAAAWTPTVIQGGQAQQPAQAATDGANALAVKPEPAGTLIRSEDGHAHQLITAYGDLIRYCAERGAWLAWTGARWAWQPKGGGVVREYAKKVARTFPQGDQAAVAHKRKCLSSAGISGCLKQAETDPRIAVEMRQLDADAYRINTPAGIVDLRTGAVAVPDPASLCTRTTTVAATAEADPLWERFLDDTFGHDPAGLQLRGYVQRFVGMTLIGQVRDQKLAFLHGQGANGKSTLAETLMHVLGVGETGYATAAPAEMLMIRKHSEHPAELAQLAGARMVVCSELDDGQRFAEAKIKQLTGRDSINARFLYGQPFTFTPTHTFWLLGNHRPQARTGGMAFWRRVSLIEFGHVVPEDQRDASLGDRLNAIGSTVLAWAIAGAVDYLAGGLREPASVAQATAAYAEEQDTIGRFVTDRCHRADSTLVQIQAAKLRNEYESWCRELGEEPASAKRLGQELRDRFNVDERKSNGTRFYTRITLLEPDPDEPETPRQSDPGQSVQEQLEGLV